MIGPRGSTNDGHPVLVLDRSGLAMITDRVQVQDWKVGEVILKNLKCLVSPEIEYSAVYYGELGMSRVV
ncbi:hypothetical protein PIB30_032128 [Stylosanthes scabra]|uniref:Uncharacterized protein n=1 Tax=Stylosanthes scabra TaxID=79078 RepID=A0ABU6VA52_9FABA|nr:hypothetical protein [Stylosanthes scabra]